MRKISNYTSFLSLDSRTRFSLKTIVNVFSLWLEIKLLGDSTTDIDVACP